MNAIMFALGTYHSVRTSPLGFPRDPFYMAYSVPANFTPTLTHHRIARLQSDISWRVVSVDPEDGSELPTLMSGDSYLPYEVRTDRWCMLPGRYRIYAFDNNIVSSANKSWGWDGGNLVLASLSGCVYIYLCKEKSRA